MASAVKVGVCLSSAGQVHTAFAVSLVAMVAGSGVPCTVISGESALIQVNRSNAVVQARTTGCTHVLFLDYDMVFPGATLLRLLDAEKEIVGCRYVRRFAPYSVLGTLLPGQTGELQEAADLPGGLMLIRMSVFDALEAPYFRCVAMPAADKLPRDLDGMDLSGMSFPDTISEDFYFCRAARRAGFKVWADLPLSMAIGHIGTEVHYIPAGGGHGV